MFLQIQDLLMLSRITTCFSESELGKLCLVNENSRRIGPTFHVPHFKSQFARSSFVCRTLRLANGLPPCIDIQEPRGLKMALMRYLIQIFMANFNELTPCTWRILCDCPNCRQQTSSHLIWSNTESNPFAEIFNNNKSSGQWSDFGLIRGPFRLEWSDQRPF